MPPTMPPTMAPLFVSLDPVVVSGLGVVEEEGRAVLEVLDVEITLVAEALLFEESLELLELEEAVDVSVVEVVVEEGASEVVLGEVLSAVFVV